MARRRQGQIPVKELIDVWIGDEPLTTLGIYSFPGTSENPFMSINCRGGGRGMGIEYSLGREYDMFSLRGEHDTHV